MKVLHVVGARPNFMKAAPVHRALAEAGHHQIIVHTGQHYDKEMSDVFFRELVIPQPDENLDVRSASHAQQTAVIMSRFEPVVVKHNPDIVLVYGDVNSTLAATLVCSKIGIRTAHVEAGLRSFDRTMPEEINRLLTDQISDILFTPSEDGNTNLEREGISPEKVHLVGNVMIDTLVRLLDVADEAFHSLRDQLGLGRFGLITLHRPGNVDDPAVFLPMLEVINNLSLKFEFVFPVHPRTRQQWRHQLETSNPGLKIIDPIGYVDFLALQKHASVVITDSGGVQEETTALGTPCLTIRENTERPITITHGTNKLIGRDWNLLQTEFFRAVNCTQSKKAPPPLWDGMASQRIARVLSSLS